MGMMKGNGHSVNNMKQPVVLVATGYPLHSDGFRSYLHGFYAIEMVGSNLARLGLSELEAALVRTQAVAIIVDDTFPHDIQPVARCVQATRSTCGLIYVDAKP